MTPRAQELSGSRTSPNSPEQFRFFRELLSPAMQRGISSLTACGHRATAGAVGILRPLGLLSYRHSSLSIRCFAAAAARARVNRGGADSADNTATASNEPVVSSQRNRAAASEDNVDDKAAEANSAPVRRVSKRTFLAGDSPERVAHFQRLRRERKQNKTAQRSRRASEQDSNGDGSDGNDTAASKANQRPIPSDLDLPEITPRASASASASSASASNSSSSAAAASRAAAAAPIAGGFGFEWVC